MNLIHQLLQKPLMYGKCIVLSEKNLMVYNCFRLKIWPEYGLIGL